MSHRDVEHCPRLGSDEYSTAPGPVSGCGAYTWTLQYLATSCRWIQVYTRLTGAGSSLEPMFVVIFQEILYQRETFHIVNLNCILYISDNVEMDEALWAWLSKSHFTTLRLEERRWLWVYQFPEEASRSITTKWRGLISQPAATQPSYCQLISFCNKHEKNEENCPSSAQMAGTWDGWCLVWPAVAVKTVPT